MSVGVVQFPGTNCEADVMEVVRDLGSEAELVWHGDDRLPTSIDALVLPGGFAHGDYLRTGAIARFSPIMPSVREFALAGGPLLGICNGFQILCEAGLLPGALQKNAGLKFLCTTVRIVVASATTSATGMLQSGDELELPINHFEGSFTCSPDALQELESNQQIVFRYAQNPNGSLGDVAGVANQQGNVVGMMPHPERACHDLLGSTDGRAIFQSLLVAGDRAPRRSAASLTSTG